MNLRPKETMIIGFGQCGVQIADRYWQSKFILVHLEEYGNGF